MPKALVTWPLWRIRRRAIALVLGVDLLALLIPILSPASITAPDVGIAVALASLSMAYSTITCRSERARRALHLGTEASKFNNIYQNMLGVWSFAAAVTLPPRLVVAVVVVAAVAEWPARNIGGQARAYRYIYSTAAAVLTASAAHACVTLDLPHGLGLALAIPAFMLVGILCLVAAMFSVGQCSGISALLRPSAHGVELCSIIIAIAEVEFMRLGFGLLAWLSLPAAILVQRYTTRAKLHSIADNALLQPMGEESWLIAATEVVAALPVVAVMRVNTADPLAASAVAQIQAGCDAIGYAGQAGLAVLLVDCPDRNADALAARLRTALLHAGVEASVVAAAKPRDGYALDDLLAVCEAELIARDAASRSAKPSRPEA